MKSYGDVLEEYEYHEEAKCADASGEPCNKQTVGLLGRRHVTIEWPPHFIGKESNKLEEVEGRPSRTPLTFTRSTPICGVTCGKPASSRFSGR